MLTEAVLDQKRKQVQTVWESLCILWGITLVLVIAIVVCACFGFIGWPATGYILSAVLFASALGAWKIDTFWSINWSLNRSWVAIAALIGAVTLLVVSTFVLPDAEDQSTESIDA